jgi:hypothetical protein
MCWPVRVPQRVLGTKLIFNHASGSAKWRVRVTQFSCDDLDLLAPAGCVTYNTEPSGNIMSYNSGTSGELINDQKFSLCIKNQDGYCDVALTSNTFDLGSGDNLSFGNNVQSGSTFGTSGSLTCENPPSSSVLAFYLLPCSTLICGFLEFHRPIRSDNLFGF